MQGREVNGSVAAWVMATVFSVCLAAPAPAPVLAAPPAEYTEAGEHLSRGRYREAREAYSEPAKTSPARIAQALGLSRVAEALGERDQAASVIAAAVKVDPKSPALLARQGELLFQRARYGDALAAASAALKLDPDTAAARLVQADCWRETGQIDEADTGYRWFIRYYNRRQPTDARTLLVVARGAVQYARWHGGSQVYRFAVNTLCPDALKADPNVWQAHYLSGSLLLEKYNRGQALEDFQKAVAINPGAADVHVAIGRAAIDHHDWATLEKSLVEARRTNPAHLGALLLEADAHLQQGRLAEARLVGERARKLRPASQAVLARLAAYHLLQDGSPPPRTLDQLLSHLDKIDNFRPDKPAAFTKLVRGLAAGNPRPGRFLAELGSQLEVGMRFALAERFYREAIRVVPQLPEPRAALGMLYMRTGRTDEARAALDAAFRADPFHVRVNNMRKVLQLLDGYETIKTKHFVIRVDRRVDRLLGGYMAVHLEQEYSRLAKVFGYEPPGPIPFEIFHTAKGQTGQEWFAARMVGLPWIQTIGASTGYVVALASPSSAPRRFNWARVLTHELVHVFTLQQTSFRIPRWFTEALAVAEEQSGGTDWRAGGPPLLSADWGRLLVGRVEANQLYKVSELDGIFIRPPTPADWQFAYCQGRLVLQFLVETHGRDAVGRLLAAYQSGLRGDDALQRACGMTGAEVDRGFLAYARELTAGLSVAPKIARRTLAEIEKAYKADPENAERAGAYAGMLLRAKRAREAGELAEKVLEKSPRNIDAALVLARIGAFARRRAEAVAVLEPALDRKKPDHRVLGLLARLRLRLGDFAEAEELFELGHRRFGLETFWLDGLAKAREGLDDTAGLKKALAELARRDSKHVGSRTQLARLQLDAKDAAGAERYAREALQVDVRDGKVHALLGEALLSQKKAAAAISEYRVAVSLDDSQAGWRLGLARALVADKQPPAARTLLERLLKDEPDNEAAKTLLESLPR